MLELVLIKHSGNVRLQNKFQLTSEYLIKVPPSCPTYVLANRIEEIRWWIAVYPGRIMRGVD